MQLKAYLRTCAIVFRVMIALAQTSYLLSTIFALTERALCSGRWLLLSHVSNVGRGQAESGCRPPVRRWREEWCQHGFVDMHLIRA